MNEFIDYQRKLAAEYERREKAGDWPTERLRTAHRQLERACFACGYGTKADLPGLKQKVLAPAQAEYDAAKAEIEGGHDG